MIQDASSTFISLFLWSIIPGFFANIALNQYYKFWFSDPRSRPVKGSPRYRRHYLNAYGAVMLAYFIYCVCQAVYDLPKNYYSKLEINRPNAEQEIKPRFKSMVMKLHPDKAPGADPQIFLEVKQIYEILESSQLRTAYEVFGETVLNSTDRSSSRSSDKKLNMRDLFDSAVMNWCVYHLGSLLVMIIISVITRNSVNYWRIVGLCFCASLELYTITRPQVILQLDKSIRFPGYQKYLGAFTIYEKMAILKCVVVNLSIVITQLISVSTPPIKPESEEVIELCRTVHMMASGPIKDFGQSALGDVQDFVSNEPSMKSKLTNAVGKLFNELDTKND